MKIQRILTIWSVLCVASLEAGEIQVFPVLADYHPTGVPIEAIAQVGSEVWMQVMVGDFAAPDSRVQTMPREVSFPTLFVTRVLDQYAWEDYRMNGRLDLILYGETQGVPNREDYDAALGNGVLRHPSFGRLEISEYPWVKSDDYGWMYFVEDGTAFGSSAWWIYEQDKGWYWTTWNTFPMIHNGEGSVNYFP
jgi:hypothetical protein